MFPLDFPPRPLYRTRQGVPFFTVNTASSQRHPLRSSTAILSGLPYGIHPSSSGRHDGAVFGEGKRAFAATAPTWG